MVNRKKIEENPESIDRLAPFVIPQLDLLYPSVIDDLSMIVCPSNPEYKEDIAEISEKGLYGIFDESNVQHFSYVYLGWAFDRLGIDQAQKISDFPLLCEMARPPLPPEMRDIEPIYVTPQFAGGIEALLSSIIEGYKSTSPAKNLLHAVDNDLEVNEPLGNNGSTTIHRLGKGIERFLVTDQNDTSAMKQCASRIGTMMDAYGGDGYMMYFNHIPGGANVLYLDGHVEFVSYVGNAPGPGIDGGATAPVLPGMAPIVDCISNLGNGVHLQLLLQTNKGSK
jgi:prepilin-type processing-associated H-X9-DG protein